jgi:hypothetical protein
MRPRLARVRKWALRSLFAATIPVATFLAWNAASGNFGTVVPGEVYRSAQMSAGGLSRTVRDHKVKTVLNLRGKNVASAWYRGEREAALGLGATQVDVAMSSCVWMSRTQLRTLVDVLQTCEKPVLMHCQWGAERTGLASAFAVLLREGSTLDDARAQFSAGYLYLPVGDGVVMHRHLEQYECWLAGNRLAHSPASFRLWVDEGYIPGKPGREEWAFDPYPLAVFTRPTPSGPEERVVWDPRGRPRAEAANVAEPTTIR